VKKKGIWLTLVVLVILVIGATMTPKKTKKEVSEPVFWVLSDTHLITSDLYESGEEFERIKLTSAGKELEYQQDSLRALVDLALEEKPTGIIITGDLTLNGERKSAEKLA
jgi:metallophosphoesterase superfamily enzyme